MPYSSQDEIPASWLDTVTLEADPDKVMVSKNGKYFYHNCGYPRDSNQGKLLPQFKHGNCYYFCTTCKVVIPPTTIMALKLGKEFNE